MKRSNWISVIVVNLLLIFLILAPHLPGPPIEFSVGLSILGQSTGLAGLLLVPIGTFWLYYEIKKPTMDAAEKFSWRIPYWMAVVSLVIVSLLLSLFALAITFQQGWLSGAVVFLFMIVVASLVFKGIRKLKKNCERKFNIMPVYLLTIPIIAFLTNLYIVKPASEYSRTVAIQSAQELIASIEDYKLKEGRYPESIDELKGTYLHKIPHPKVMGITSYRYNKINEDYSLSFSQWLEWGSLEVIVLYDKSNLRNRLKGRYAEWDYSFDLCRTNAAFASYDTKFENWRYYLCD